MKIAIFAYSHGGCAAARRVRAVLAEAETVCYAVPRLEEAGFLPLAKDIYRERFSSMDALIFIGACGIAVREIAPYLVSKKTDPAVLCIDEKMQFVIPLLSGHIGGANDLARRLAAALGASAVITTATDVNGKFAVDAWAAKNGCAALFSMYSSRASGMPNQSGSDSKTKRVMRRFSSGVVISLISIVLSI